MGFKISKRAQDYFAATAGSWHAHSTGLNSYAELQAWHKLGQPSMPIYVPTDADVGTSIFRTQRAFMDFQAWHDRRHISEAQPFTLAGERVLARRHVDEMLRADLNSRDASAVYFLIYGRNRFFFNNGHRSVASQSDFVAQAFREGVETAARDRRGRGLDFPDFIAEGDFPDYDPAQG
jgi:hypothetical protein